MAKGGEELGALLSHRFGEEIKAADSSDDDAVFFKTLAARGSCRRFTDDPVESGLVRMLCALALSAPTKSDLQQRDIVVVSDPEIRGQINALFPNDDWIAQAPAFILFCGNNRRQRLMHEWRGRPFVNDHLDAFFNAAVDSGIALATFVLAAEAAGLGCCPISAVRNHAERVSDMVGLPDHVFPVAGLTLGYPADRPPVSLRLPLGATVHENRYQEVGLRAIVEAYDRRRADIQPYRAQRFSDEYGEQSDYGWSEDKTRQYSKLERDDFGDFVKRKGFSLK